jgi:hypothetical protein
MIVRQHERGWEITSQRAHGILATQLGFHWQAAQRPIRFAETLIALAEHDDCQQDRKGRRQLTPAGAPIHFELLEYDLDQAREICALSLNKGRWNALLTSMHMDFLYEEKRAEDEQLAAFLDKQKKLRTKWLRALGVSKAEAQQAYEFLEWCDAFSLLLCLGKIQPEERRMDISCGPDGTMYQVWQRTKDGSLSVEPWPYDCEKFVVRVDYRVVEQLQFKDSNELADALDAAPIASKEWLLRK